MRILSIDNIIKFFQDQLKQLIKEIFKKHSDVDKEQLTYALYDSLGQSMKDLLGSAGQSEGEAIERDSLID